MRGPGRLFCKIWVKFDEAGEGQIVGPVRYLYTCVLSDVANQISVMSIAQIPPPTDGSVTLPETVDFHRQHNPTLPVYVFVEDGASNTTEISYLEFGRACDRVAHYLRSGRRGPEREPVAVMALSDTLLYQTLVVGIMRAGLIVTITLHFVFVVSC